MTAEDYHIIKQGDLQMRLFKSVINRRLTEFGESFEEYKVRLKIMRKLLREQKKKGYSNEQLEKLAENLSV